MPNETITIEKDVYDELMRRDWFLGALEAAGVDNWEGYADVQNSPEGEPK